MEFFQYSNVCKAKTLSSESWIEGYYIELDGKSYILTKENGIVIEPNCAVQKGMVAIEVNNKTVCKCYGKKDKNGKYIFEKDIVEDIFGERYVVVYQDNGWWLYGDSFDDNHFPNLNSLTETDNKRLKIIESRIDYKGLLNPKNHKYSGVIPTEYL